MDYLNYSFYLFNLQNYFYNILFDDYLIFFFFLINYSISYYLLFFFFKFLDDYFIIYYLKNINNKIILLTKKLSVYNLFKFFYQRLEREAYYSSIEIFNNDLSLYEKKGSNGYIFYFWRLLKESYKLQILSLVISLIFRIIYFIFIYSFYYLFILILRFLYKNIFFYNFYYILIYFFIYLNLNIYKYININKIINFWIFYDNIKSKWVIFFHQLELTVNWVTIFFMNFIYHKKFKNANINLINTGETIPLSNFIKNKIKWFLPFIQNYKIKIFSFKIYLNIFLLDVFFNLLLIFFTLLKNILKNINNKLNYFLYLIELKVFKYIFILKNIFNLKLIIIFFFIFFSKYFLLLIFFIYYEFIKVYLFKLLNKLSLFNNLNNILFWVIGFIFYYLVYYFLNILSFFFKKFFLLIYKFKFIIIFFFFFFTLGLDITIIYLVIDTIWYYLGYMYILNFLSTFFYSDWFILLWERFSIENQIIWELKSQEVINTWLFWTYNSEFIFKDLCINALDSIKKIDTLKKIWTIMGPISFLMFLWFDLKLIEIIISFFIWVVKLFYCYLYLNITPFLFINIKDYYFLYFYFWIFFKYIFLVLKYIKIYFLYLYCYWLPYNFNILYSFKIYWFYNIYFYYKYEYIYYFLNFFGLINLNFKINNLLLLINYLFIINKLFFYFFLDINITNIFKNLNIFFFDLFYYFINFWVYPFFSKIPKFYINIYFFLNYWYELQSNLDLIFSYFRFSRYKFNKWIYKFNYLGPVEDEAFIHSFFSGLVEPINLDFPVNCWFKNDHQLIIYNINIYIKYWKWQYWMDFQPLSNYMFITRFNDFLLRNYIYYFIYIYIITYFLFKFIYNIYKAENYFFNSNYLWYLVRKNFNLKNFKNKVYNKEKSNIVNVKLFFNKLKNKKKNKLFFLLTKIKKNLFLKLNKYLKKKIINKSSNLLINISKIIKYNIIYLNKYNNLNYYIYLNKKTNYLYKKFIYSDFYSFFYSNFTKHNDIFNFFLAYIYKKNKYIKYIFMQENEVILENIWKYPLSYNDINYKYFYKTSKNLSINIINYFFFIEKKIFNYNSPSWLLHKNKSTFFLIKSKSLDSCSISISYDFPFDVDFFFILILPQAILLNFFFYGQENEACYLGLNQQRQLIWFISIILSSLNFDIFWHIFINYLSYWERFQADEYIQNVISNGGEELAYKQIYSEKFYIIDLFWKYRSLYDLEYNYFSNFKFNFIQHNELKLFYYFQIFFIIFLLFFYKFKILSFNFIKLRLLNFKMIMLVKTYYKLKLLSLKNYMIKK